MINFEDPYVYLPIIIFCIIIILFLTDTIKLNFINQQEGFSSKMENELQNYKRLYLLKKDTNDLDIKKINKVSENILKLDEIHSLKSIEALSSLNNSGPDKVDARKYLEMYNSTKDAIKGSIKFLENAKKRNNKNAITANDNDEFLEGNIGDEAEKKSSWI